MKKIIILLITFITYGSIQAQTKVTFFTSEGRFVVEIYDNIVPVTGGNFLGLVNQKFYDGIIFHRVIKNFMIQGGDPTGSGSGGSGVTIPDEFDSSLSNIQKTISMANSGPNTGTSQFFINLVDNTFLDFDKAPSSSKHPVFGIVTDNFNVVQTIGNVATNAQNKPIAPVVMDSIRVGELLYSGISNDQDFISQMRIVPNPSEGINNSFLLINSLKSREAQLTIYDSQGRRISGSKLRLLEGINRLHLHDNIQSEITSGLYFINLTLDGQTYNQTLILK